MSHHPWLHPLPATQHSLTHNPTLTLIEGTSSQGAVVCHTTMAASTTSHTLTHNPTLTLIEGTSSQGAVVCHTTMAASTTSHTLTHTQPHTHTDRRDLQPGSSGVSHHPWLHQLPATHSLTHNPTLTLIEGSSSQGAVVCHTTHREARVLCLHSYTAITSLQG